MEEVGNGMWNLGGMTPGFSFEYMNDVPCATKGKQEGLQGGVMGIMTS